MRSFIITALTVALCLGSFGATNTIPRLKDQTANFSMPSDVSQWHIKAKQSNVGIVQRFYTVNGSNVLNLAGKTVVFKRGKNDNDPSMASLTGVVSTTYVEFTMTASFLAQATSMPWYSVIMVTDTSAPTYQVSQPIGQITVKYAPEVDANDLVTSKRIDWQNRTYANGASGPGIGDGSTISWTTNANGQIVFTSASGGDLTAISNNTPAYVYISNSTGPIPGIGVSNVATAVQGISGTNAETIVLANSNAWTTAYIYGTGWVASVAYNITAGLTNQWTHTATLQEAVTAGGTVTNGTVTIDAANARTNTYGGLLTILGDGIQSGSGTASGTDGATALGYQTTASGNLGATALGKGTIASGSVGATALGDTTTASGSAGATAGGYRARAIHNGTFIMADASVTNFVDSTVVNQCRMRYANGYDFTGGPIGGNASGLTNIPAAQLTGNVPWQGFTYSGTATYGPIRLSGGGISLVTTNGDGSVSYTFPSVPSGTNYATAAQGISGTNAETIVLANSNEWTQAGATGVVNAAAIAVLETNTVTKSDTNGWVVTDTTYTAGTNLALNGTEFNLDGAAQASDDLADSAVQDGDTLTTGLYGPEGMTTNQYVNRKQLYDRLDELAVKTLYGSTTAHPSLAGAGSLVDVASATAWASTNALSDGTNYIGYYFWTNSEVKVRSGNYIGRFYCQKTAGTKIANAKIQLLYSDTSTTNILDTSAVSGNIGATLSSYRLSTENPTNVSGTALFVGVRYMLIQSGGGSAATVVTYGGDPYDTHLDTPGLGLFGGEVDPVFTANSNLYLQSEADTFQTAAARGHTYDGFITLTHLSWTNSLTFYPFLNPVRGGLQWKLNNGTFRYLYLYDDKISLEDLLYFSSPKNPTTDDHVGARGYNDKRYAVYPTYCYVDIPLNPGGYPGNWTDYEIKIVSAPNTATEWSNANMVYWYQTMGDPWDAPTTWGDTNASGYFVDDHDAWVGEDRGLIKWSIYTNATAGVDVLSIAGQLVSSNSVVETVRHSLSHNCIVDWLTWQSSTNQHNLRASFVRYDALGPQTNEVGGEVWQPLTLHWTHERMSE